MDEKSENIILNAVITCKYLADHLKEYSSSLEDYLKREESAMWDPYSPDVPRPEVLDLDRYWGISVFYPTILRESILVVSFSNFESVMNELCLRLREARELTVSLSDLNGRGISRACKFLTKVAGLSVPDSVLVPVLFLNRLRNLIVHNNSTVNSKNSEDRKLLETAKRWTTVEVPQDGRIKFHSGFNEMALDAFLEFFDQLRRNNPHYAA